MNNIELIATGIAFDSMAGKAAVKARIFWGLAYYRALEQSDTIGRDMLATLRATLDPQKGPRKGHASMACRAAKKVGANLSKRFGAELASDWQDDGDMVQAMFLAATASGVNSVATLEDFAEHGDALHTFKMKEAAKAEKDAKAAEEAAKAQAAMEEAQAKAVAVMDFDYVPNPLPRAEVPMDQDGGESVTVDLARFADMLRHLSPEQVEGIAAACAEDLARRSDTSVAKLAKAS